MKLVLEEEQRELATAVRRLVAERAGSEEIRSHIDSAAGYDETFWKHLADMGLLALTVPEKFGGAGAGHVERSLVQEELGRGLVPSPFLASAVLATDALLEIGDEAACAAHLPGLVAGRRIGTVAVAEDGEAWPSSGGSALAVSDGDGWRLTGTNTRVVNGASADLIIVYASAPDGPAWFVVEGDAPGITRTPQAGLDHLRRFASLTFAATPATLLNGADPRAALDRVRDLAAVAVAAEQVGGHERALSLTADYAKVRMQFGRHIGSYQAVKHGIVDMYCGWELALSVVRYAAWTADEAPLELPAAAAAAQVFAGQAYFDAAASMIQYHGGIGYTWEHDAHLFFKRAKSSQLMFGSPAEHRARLADHLEA